MKTLLYTLSFVLVSTWGVAQNAVNDYFNINQKATKYPGFGVSTYQGLLGGGHPYVLMGNYGGNTANKSATPNNVILGSLIFNGYDGKNNIQIGRIETYSTETFSEKNYPVKMRFLVGGTATCCGKERMTIDGQTGNIGIGTATPKEKLHVNSGAIIGKSSFSRTQSTHENSWIRDDWLTGNRGAPVWDQTKKRWIRPLGTYNDFGGIIWQDEGVYFIKQNRGTKTEFTNDEMLNTAFLFANTFSKNIGIGTTTPDQKLTVQGSVNIGGTSNATLRVRHIEGKHHENANYANLHLNYISGKDVYVGNPHNSNLYSNLLVTGNVGIGTTNPKEKLSVNGNIRAKEVKVEIENWPDYVFKNDYKLLSLADVKKHIATKGHLPNIPSAKEISEQGAALGALNVKLLEKIEELTLYTLDQEAQLQQQQHTINTLMERLTQIESQLNQHEKPTP